MADKPQPAFSRVTVPDEAPAKASKGGKLESISIDVASNGYVVRERRAQKPSKGNSPMAWQEPESVVFESAASLLAHLTKVLA